MSNFNTNNNEAPFPIYPFSEFSDFRFRVPSYNNFRPPPNCWQQLHPFSRHPRPRPQPSFRARFETFRPQRRFPPPPPHHFMQHHFRPPNFRPNFPCHWSTQQEFYNNHQLPPPPIRQQNLFPNNIRIPITEIPLPPVPPQNPPPPPQSWACSQPHVASSTNSSVGVGEGLLNTSSSSARNKSSINSSILENHSTLKEVTESDPINTSNPNANTASSSFAADNCPSLGQCYNNKGPPSPPWGFPPLPPLPPVVPLPPEPPDIIEIPHGRVQSVKLLDGASNSPRSVKNATVAFIDIKSATKALRNVRTVGGQTIQVSYYEPGSSSNNVPRPSSLQPPLQILGETSLSPSEAAMLAAQGITPPIPPTNNIPVVNNNNCIPNSPATAGGYRQRFSGQHGQSEDSSSHFYDQPKSFSRGRGDFHGGRGRRENRPPFQSRHSFPENNNNNSNRNYRNSQWNNNYHHEGGRYAPPSSETDERPVAATVPPTHNNSPSEANTKGPRRPESPASSVSSRHLISKRRKSRSVSDSGSSDRGSSGGGSRSRSGSRSSVSTSVSSSRSRSPSHNHGHFTRGAGTPNNNDRFHQTNYSRNNRYSRSRVLTRGSESRINSRSPLAASPSSSSSSSSSSHRKITAPNSPSHSPSSSKSYSPSRNAGGSQHNNHHHHHRRNPTSAELHAAIKIRNLPIRSSDTSLKDGLYHEYKKCGKVAWVRVSGNGQERFAIVCFKSAEHATRAVSVSQGKLFFGCKIQVSPCNHAKGEDNLEGQDEENRLLVEDEPSSVGYPTRTVLITGLDASVTSKELQSAFDQYGDIVRIDIRKQGTATHAVCEFVDIASAIRAQWGRHVFKLKEARISFYRNPPTNALLLDGAAGVTDKQVYGQCCQYGAIKEITMDTERVLALVQFQEISSAQTGIRSLRSWVIKGKRLQVDFASSEVIRRFRERVSTTGGISSPVDSSSPGIISSPSIGNSIGPLHDTMNLTRKKSKIEDEDSVYSDDPAEGYRKSDRTIIRTNFAKSQLLSESADSAAGSRTVSPDVDHFLSRRQTQPKPFNTTIKIDLNCHETDSAVVTSSSDIVVGEPNEVHSNSEIVCDDNKLSGTESDGEARDNNSRSAITFLDGVSSTSPEPKSETVRKASPDSAIGPCTIHSRSYSKGVIDPRRHADNYKIRRSSADCGNSSSSRMHSTSSSSSSSTFQQPLASTTTTSDSGVVVVIDDDSDDRPGTPLCDENDSFETTTTTTTPIVLNSPPVKPVSSSFSSNVKSDPISLPLPEFARQNRQRTDSNASSVREFPSSSVRNSRCSTESDPPKSPVKSPPYHDHPATVSPVDVDDSIASINESSCSKASPPTTSINNNNEGSLSPLKQENEHCLVSDETTIKVGELKEEKEEYVVDIDGFAFSPSSDSDGLSPKRSPASAALEERILKCCETYDRYSGNKLANEATGIIGDPNNSGEDATNSKGLQSSLSTDSFTLESPSTRFKFLDWTELMNRPSDIGKSVLARKSVFDEDSKRLENFGEKYEGKSPINQNCNNWRAIALQRSLSVSCSSSSSSSAYHHHPPLPSSNNIAANNIPSLSARSSSVSSVPTVNSFSSKASPGVFQSKPKDLNHLNLNSSNNNKPNQLLDHHHHHPQHHHTMTRAFSHPSSSTAINTNQPKLIPHHRIVDPPQKSPCLKTEELIIKDIKDINPIQNPEHPPALIFSTRPTIAPSDLLTRTIGEKSIIVSPEFPRPIERSLSVDSKKGTSSQSHQSLISPSSTTTTTTASSTGGNSRRSSVDSHYSHPSVIEAKKHYLPTPTTTTSICAPTLQISCAKPINTIMESSSSTPTPTNVLQPSTIEKEPNKDSKTELDFMKKDITGIRPAQQEATTIVAVVAAEHTTPFISSRSDSVGSSSSSKDTSRKEKEKKQRGTSIPVSSLPPTTTTVLNTNNSNSTTRSDVAAASITPHNSTRESVAVISATAGSVKRDEKKENKKESSSSSKHHDTSVSGTDEGSKKSGDKDNKKDGKKEKRDSHKESSENQKLPLTESHSHHKRPDKDTSSSSKRKRHGSGIEADKDSDHHHQKKIKVEKEPHEASSSVHHHHRLKSSSTHERRESRDSSSSNKDKTKDLGSRSSSFSQSDSHIVAKKEIKDESSKSSSSSFKESHHNRVNKDKSTATGSSKEKHHSSSSGGDKSRTTSESRPSHSSQQPTKSSSSSGHSKSDKDKDRSKKDNSNKERISPGKENVKGSSSKHHSSSGSSSHRSSSNRLKDGSSSIKSSSHDSHKRSGSEKQHNTSVESDSCGELSGRLQSSSSKSHKSSRSDKSESEKRERRRSGDISTGDSDKKKNRDKKKKRFVIEETESSDSDDEEKKKHHSIFDVVVDEYVSMYDKVKARSSSRACKAQPRQQKQAAKKQDKIKDQFRQLKQSRAKKIEKKRSTSVDESNKSGMHTSSDDDVMVINDDHNRSSLKYIKEMERRKSTLSLSQSSDDDDETEKERIRSKLLKKSKSNKKKSSSDKSSDKSIKKKVKKSSKSPPPKGFNRSMESVFSNSQSDSNASSSREPLKKRKRLSSIKLPSTDLDESSKQTLRYQSSEESLSDSEDSEASSVIPKHDKRSKINISSGNKLQARDIYSDSDSSVESSGPGPPVVSQKSVKLSSSGLKSFKGRDKSSKPKSMKKALFESSDSSEDEKPLHDTARKEKLKESMIMKSSNKDKDSLRKKHKTHSSSTSKPIAKTNIKRIGSGETSVDNNVGIHLLKRESTSTMKDILFGPMSASSGSEEEENKRPIPEQLPRPKTPTIVSHEPSKKLEQQHQQQPHHSPKKSKLSLSSEDRQYSRSISPSSSQDLSADLQPSVVVHALQDSNKSKVMPTAEAEKLEKKKKRHHKDKKSKRGDTNEDHYKIPKLSSSSSANTETKPNLDSLFNSPRVSPTKEFFGQQSVSPRIKQESVSSSSSIESRSLIIPSPTKTNTKNFESDVTGDPSKSMFSSDDDDDDKKLKSEINIIVSSDEPGIEDSINSSIITVITSEQRKREEEEKQMHSLFEQDKAIESIVLLDRKSPPAIVAEDELAKDDNIPKDCTAISQEETEDAVAALLFTLGDDENMEEGSPAKPSIPTSSAVNSPPTLRIIEESDSNEVTILPSSSLAFEPEKISTHERTSTSSPSKSRKSSIDAEEKNSSSVEQLVAIQPLRRSSGSVKSRQGSAELEHEADATSSADVYEFRDSDDDEGDGKGIHVKQLTPPRSIETTMKSPLSSSPLPTPSQPLVETKSQPTITATTTQGVTPPLVTAIPTSVVQQHHAVGIPPPIIVSSSASLPSSASKPYTPVTPVAQESFQSAKSIVLASSGPITRAKTPPTSSSPVAQKAEFPRNKVDDTIEHVIRMAQEEDPSFSKTPPTALTTTIKPGVRGRSKSKDSDENSSISITKINRADATLQSNIPTSVVTQHQPIESPQIHPVIIKTEKENLPVIKEDSSSGLETLIDPQTGILMPMLRQSDEGQYVPILGQEASLLPKVQTPQFSAPCFQSSKTEQQNQPPKPSEESNKPVIHSSSNQTTTNEGLAATMMSHQKVFQQQIPPHPHSTIPTATTTPTTIAAVSKTVPASKFTNLATQGQQQQQQAPAQIFVSKSANPLYAGPGSIHVHNIIKAPVSSGVSPGQAVMKHPQQQQQQQQPPEGVPVSNFAHGSMIRAIFPGQPGAAHLVPITTGSGQFQYAVPSRSNEGPSNQAQSSPRQTTAMHPMQQQQQHQQTLMQNKYGQPPLGAHGQSDIKNFQIPSATTITKVNNTSQDEGTLQRKPMMPQGTYVMSTPSLRSASPNVGTKQQFMAAPPLMTQQQIQQHQAQTELFRKSVEGSIRKDEHHHMVKGQQEMGGIVQPPRVDISLNISQATAASHSPKGRILGAHHEQQLQQQHPLFPRLQQCTMAHESGEVRILSASNPGVADHPQLIQVSHSGYPHHTYNAPKCSPPTSIHGGRGGPIVGMPEKMEAYERSRMPQNMPQHSAIQHLPTPHSIDQRNSESPSMYRHPYQIPSPAHQMQGQRMFPEHVVERQQHSHSPSYPPQIDPRMMHQPDREKILSPYARESSMQRSFSPPTAHGRYSVPPQGLDPHPDNRQRIIRPPSPPSSSQAQPQGDTLLNLLQRYAIMWQGLLALKNDNAACQMHFVSGNINVARDSLPTNPDGTIPPLRISQRMRLEPTQLDGVARKMQLEPEHCILLALPCGRDHLDVLQQSNNLRNGFITYLQLKQAAGIVNIPHPETGQPEYVIHIFPSCDFANENLARIAPDLLHGVADIAHLLIVVATV